MDTENKRVLQKGPHWSLHLFWEPFQDYIHQQTA